MKTTQELLELMLSDNRDLDDAAIKWAYDLGQRDLVEAAKGQWIEIEGVPGGGWISIPKLAKLAGVE